MSYFLPPEVADLRDPKPEQGAARPSRTSGSLKSITKKEDKPKVPRSSSLGDWWRNMLPSQKPERGGTARESEATGSESGVEKLRKPYRRATDGRRSRRSETHDSDRFTGWNLAKEVSESNDTGMPLAAASGRRAVSHAAGTSLQSSDISDRKWSWVPQIQLPEQLSVKPSDPRDQKVSWQDTALEDEPQISADYLADRRLSSARRAIEAKKEARRQRRSLKESGDYLGVQGINPETGQLDVLTPSNSDNSTNASEINQKIEAVKKVLEDSRTQHKNKHLLAHNEREVKRLHLKREKEKRARDEKRKQELAARQNQGLRWKRHRKQWSSAQEPALSPIAQSVRSGTPGSRRPSHPFNEMNQEEELVDLASMSQFVDTGKELPALPDHGTSRTTSKSGTVVHTHKPESSAAMELFENGISFDHEAQPSKGPQEEKASFPFSRLSATDSARRDHSGLETENAQTSFPEDNLGTKAAMGSDTPKGQSFLDLPALGGPVSQGRNSDSIPRPLSTTDLLGREKSSTPKRSISIFPKKHRSAHWLNRVSPPSDSPGSNSIPASKTLTALLTPTRMNEIGGEAHSLLEGSPLHGLSPTHLLQRVRKKRMQRGGNPPARNELGQPITALESLTNLNQVQQAQDHAKSNRSPMSEENVLPLPRESSTEAKVSPVEIQEDLDYLKKEVAKVDKLQWMTEREASGPLQTDIEWIEGTIKDITEKGDRVLGKPACTPITTTTGFAHLAFGSSPSKEGSEYKARRSPQLAQGSGSRKPSRAVSNLASKISPRNHRPSSLLRLTPEGQIVPIDITSMEVPIKDCHREGANSFPSMSTSTSAKAVEMGHTTTPLHHPRTSPPMGGKPEQQPEVVRAQTHVGLTPGMKLQAQEESPNDEVYDRQRKLVQQHPQGTSEQHPQDLIKAIPGAYPFHPGGEEDTDDPFEELKMSQAIQRLRDLGEDDGNLWEAVKEFLFVARCHIEVTLRLYWSVTGPVFNSRSQYWVRNKSGNATLLDGLAFILAVPGAFLGLLVFV